MTVDATKKNKLRTRRDLRNTTKFVTGDSETPATLFSCAKARSPTAPGSRFILPQPRQQSRKTGTFLQLIGGVWWLCGSARPARRRRRLGRDVPCPARHRSRLRRDVARPARRCSGLGRSVPSPARRSSGLGRSVSGRGPLEEAPDVAHHSRVLVRCRDDTGIGDRRECDESQGGPDKAHHETRNAVCPCPKLLG